MELIPAPERNFCEDPSPTPDPRKEDRYVESDLDTVALVGGRDLRLTYLDGTTFEIHDVGSQPWINCEIDKSSFDWATGRTSPHKGYRALTPPISTAGARSNEGGHRPGEARKIIERLHYYVDAFTGRLLPSHYNQHTTPVICGALQNLSREHDEAWKLMTQTAIGFLKALRNTVTAGMLGGGSAKPTRVMRCANSGRVASSAGARGVVSLKSLDDEVALLNRVVSTNRTSLARDVGAFTPDALQGTCGLSSWDIIRKLRHWSGGQAQVFEHQALKLFGAGDRGFAHAFAVVRMPSGKTFLVDTTFLQFLNPLKAGPRQPGYAGKLMLESPGGRTVAEALSQRGYIELTDDVAEVFGYALSGGARTRLKAADFVRGSTLAPETRPLSTHLDSVFGPL